MCVGEKRDRRERKSNTGPASPALVHEIPGLSSGKQREPSVVEDRLKTQRQIEGWVLDQPADSWRGKRVDTSAARCRPTRRKNGRFTAVRPVVGGPDARLPSAEHCKKKSQYIETVGVSKKSGGEPRLGPWSWAAQAAGRSDAFVSPAFPVGRRRSQTAIGCTTQAGVLLGRFGGLAGDTVPLGRQTSDVLAANLRASDCGIKYVGRCESTVCAAGYLTGPSRCRRGSRATERLRALVQFAKGRRRRLRTAKRSGQTSATRQHDARATRGPMRIESARPVVFGDRGGVRTNELTGADRTVSIDLVGSAIRGERTDARRTVLCGQTTAKVGRHAMTMLRPIGSRPRCSECQTPCACVRTTVASGAPTASRRNSPASRPGLPRQQQHGR